MNDKLYKLILRDISKTVKKHINEDLMNDLYDIDQENNLTTDIADKIYKNNSNVFHMELLTDSFIFYSGFNLKYEYDYDEVRKLLEPFANLSEELLCKLLTLLLKLFIPKELNDLADITVVNVYEFNNIIEYDDLGMMRIEVKNLKESDYAKFYKIMRELDNRDYCYLANWWFNGSMESTDTLKFVKWVFDNEKQLDNDDKSYTFKQFLAQDYLKK